MFFSFLNYSFVQNALIAGTLISLIAPIIGQYLIVRRFSALADTLSHVSLVGVAISLLFKWNSIISALISTILASLSIEIINRKKPGYSESTLTLFLTAGLGLSSILISLGKGFSTSIYSYLFGSINTISFEDIYIIICVFLVVSGVIFWKRKEFFITSLDPEIAQSQRISPHLYNTLIMILAALIISVGIQVIGILLISSLMILPVLTSMQYKKGFYETMIISSSLAVLSVWLGISISFNTDIATGGTIVMCNVFFYIVSLFIPNILTIQSKALFAPTNK